MSADNYLVVDLLPGSDTEAGVWMFFASDDDGSERPLSADKALYVGGIIDACDYADRVELNEIVEYGQMYGARLKAAIRRLLDER